MLLMTIWRFIFLALRALQNRVPAFTSSSSPVSNKAAVGEICLTDFTVEIINPDARLQISAESQLYIEFTLRSGTRTRAHTLGPFARESEWSWKLPEHFRINAEVTSAKLVGYIRKVDEQDTFQIGSTDTNYSRLLRMRLDRHTRWNDILQDGDHQMTSKLSANIVISSEESAHDMKQGGVDIGVVSSTRGMEATRLPPLADEQLTRVAELRDIGIRFHSQFQRTGDLSDIEEATKYFRQAINLIPDGHPFNLPLLNDLGKSFTTQSWRTGVLGDIEKAIEYLQKAVLLTPDGHPCHPEFLGDLGSAFVSRFQHTNELSDLKKAIEILQQTVSLTPDEDPTKPVQLNNLGNALWSRFHETDAFGDIEEAIRNFQQALRLTPEGHPSRALLLGNIGISFDSRFNHTGALSDIDEAIKNTQQAISLTLDKYNKANLVSNLGISFGARFDMVAVLSDIEEAIKNHQLSISLTPDGHPSYPSRLNHLGNSFHRRFERTGVFSDLEVATEYLQQAALLVPDRHRSRLGFLSCLGDVFHTRFKWTQMLADLEQSIKIHQQVVLLTPDGHPKEAARLGDLGNVLRNRFLCTKVLNDIEEAISNHQKVVQLTSEDHPFRAARLNNLGISFQSRFDHTAVLSDIDNAIRNIRDAVLSTPDRHPSKSRWLFNLGISFRRRFDHCGAALSDFEASISQFRLAAELDRGSPLISSLSSLRWARSTAKHDPASALEAYRKAFDLLPRIVWIGDPISVRHLQLHQLDDLPREAAAFAIDVHRLDLALEWLEQGRSVVWNQLLNLRTPDDSLQRSHPDLHERLTLVSRQLQSAATRDHGIEGSFDVRIWREQETQSHHRLAEEWDSLVNQVRSLTGFHDFLFPKKASTLSKAARLGPVVVINVHESRCDALVLRTGVEKVHHISLDGLSCADVEEMVKWLREDLASSSYARQEGRARKPFKTGGPRLEKILSRLWLNVVRPILQSLDMMTKKSDRNYLSRIWWCPTGPLTFLPLHAAGTEVPGGRDEISDYVVSSYIPTVSALLAARAGNRQPFKHLVGIAMTENPPHHGLNALPNARIELEKIGSFFSAECNWSFKTLRNRQATKDQVLADMANCSWVHLACRGVQDSHLPTQSGLWLHDGCLTITDLISRRFDHADLAYLSACQTATGDEKSSDEAVHITAAMLGAGYRSVIGTMWSIPDEVAPILAGKVYEHLLIAGKADSEQAARALYEGIKELRKSGEYSFYSWVPFVHYGL